jgi:DNA-binding NarL/FixJ family response regulator
VLIVDDQTLMREGLKTIIDMEEDMQVVGCAANGKEAYHMTRELQPDVILMDIRMPEMDGVESTRIIKKEIPQTTVIVLTTFDDDEYIIDALRHGASGYLLKDIPAEELLKAIRDGAAGDILMHGSVAAKLAARVAMHEPRVPTPELSPREIEIAELMLKGLSNREIADSLYITEGTVKNYITVIYSKLGTSNRAQAIARLGKIM